MIELPEGKTFQDKGVWQRRFVVTDNDATKKETAHVSCPSCGNPASLVGHTIARDGRVEPSLICPHPPCEFHEWVTLIGWNRREPVTEGGR